MAPRLDLLHIAQRAASRAGDYLQAIARPADPAGWVRKGRADFVTEVDRTAERIIRDVLLTASPDSTVVGEELSPEVVREGLVWIVDPLRLIFELGHPLQLADRRDRVQQPLQFRMLRHMRLNEERRALRIDTRGEQTDRHLSSPGGQRPRIVGVGDGMQIDDAENAFMHLLQPDPVLDRTEPVADVEFTGRLNS